MSNKRESIELSLPVNPAYVSAARLTASTIANRMKFDIDEIEDIKAAVSEGCAFIIGSGATNDKAMFKIVFSISDNELKIELHSESDRAKGKEGDMSLVMIKALMNSTNVEICEGEFIRLSMLKIHKAADF